MRACSSPASLISPSRVHRGTLRRLLFPHGRIAVVIAVFLAECRKLSGSEGAWKQNKFSL